MNDNTVNPIGSKRIDPQHFVVVDDVGLPNIDHTVPSTSLLALAQVELQSISNEAIQETLEDMSLALAGRLRASRRGSDVIASSEDDNPSTRRRELLAKLVRQVDATDSTRLDLMLRRFPGLEQDADPFERLRRGGAQPGEIALMLAGLLARQGARGSGRRLNAALDAVVSEEGDELGIQVFSVWEFDELNGNLNDAMKRLYRDTVDKLPGLGALFARLIGLPERRRRLKALIRAIAFELSAHDPDVCEEPARMMAVLGDLRRLLLFFGLAEECGQMAQQFATVDDTQLLGELVAVVEQSWVDPDWLMLRMQNLGVTELPQQLVYTRQFGEMCRFLPLTCFSDDDQRDRLLEAFAQLGERLAEQE